MKQMNTYGNIKNTESQGTRLLTLAISSLLVVLLLLPGSALAVGGQGKKDPIYELHVLHFNDGESQLINAPGQPDFGGIARFVTVARQLRLEALKKNFDRRDHRLKAVSVTISSGDNFLAGPEFNASLVKGVPYYDSIGLSILNVDAFSFGNHEFDFGPDVTEEFIEGFFRRSPFLSANLDFINEPGLQRFVDKGVIRKSIIVKKAGRKIGIIGAQYEELSTITTTRDIIVNEVLHAVQSEVNRLENMGANIIILSSHLQGIDEDFELIPQLSGVDIVIAGGGDELLADENTLLVPGDDPADAYGSYPQYASNADGAMVPVVTTPGDYKYMGRLIARFDKDGNLIGVDDSSGLVRVAGGDNPDAVRANRLATRFVVDPVVEAVAALAANIIGTSEVALEGRRDPGIRTEETNLGNLCADALRYTGTQLAPIFGTPLPDVALQNGGGIRNNNLIPAGDITELTTFDILPFSNFVAVFPEIPRDQFKEILENAVSRVEGASGRFAQISGFSFEYDPDGAAQELDDNNNVVTPGNRVQEVVLDDGTVLVTGGVVVAGPPISVATIDFLARGGDQYPFRDAPFEVLGESYQQSLFNYITSSGPDGLDGLISAAQYPEGGEGRITTTTTP